MGEMVIELEIVEARDLLASDSNGFSDPYVIVEKKCGLTSGAKTPVIKKTLNPVWNYQTVLHFDPSFSKIKFKVFDWDRFSSDDPLGSCSFSSSILSDGVPIDIWEPLQQKPKKKAKGAKGPWPTKGELHIRMTAKNWCQFCDIGGWYALQAGAAAGPGPVVVETNPESASSIVPFGTDVSLGIGWDFVRGHRVDLDASVIAFGAKNEEIDTVFFGHRSGCGGAIKHTGDNVTGRGDGDDEVINLSLQKMPPNVFRLVCVVNCFSGGTLASAKSAFVRLFTGPHTIGAQKLTAQYSTTGLIFCFLQRNTNGAWFFQTVLRPIVARSAKQSIGSIQEFLSTIPLF